MKLATLLVLIGFGTSPSLGRDVVVAKHALQSAAEVKQAMMAMREEEPNPPIWPDSVKIIHPSESKEEILLKIKEAQDSWNEEHQSFTSDHHFSSRRFAVMFAPGVYHEIDFEVGYYTQLLGLGKSPDHVQFKDCKLGPYVPALNFNLHEQGTCLDTFWRSGENFASFASDGMRWAVSQAAPLRRVHVHGDLNLFHGGAYASGGHFANSRVEGHTEAGGQQQFLYRNVDLKGGASGGAWSMVYAGCTGDVPEPSTGSGESASVTVLPVPTVRIEKPYVAMADDGSGRFELRVPLPLRESGDVVGPTLDGSNEEVRNFKRVRVVSSEEPVSRIQEALDEGKDVVLAAGIFTLTQSLELRTPNQVLLGIGMATVVAPKDGSPCIRVAPGVPGIRVAGLMLEASQREPACSEEAQPTTLLQWGEPDTEDKGNPSNPGSLHDVFCRVGGATMGKRDAIAVDTMMRIFSGHVVGDDLWLWRADHAELQPGEVANYPDISPIYWQSEQNEFRVETGLEVFGDDVTIHGLAVEHANGHQTVWHGERGRVVFYQCELPYGVSQETFGDKNFRGYLVHEKVEDHEVHGPGIYSNFRNGQVVTATAMEHPEVESVNVVNPFTVRLDNYYGIGSVANFKGGAASEEGRPTRIADGASSEHEEGS